MIKINDYKMIDKYILKYNISEIFTKDMRQFMELLLFKKNEYICKENEYIKYLFFVIEGNAKVYVTLSNGKSLLTCFYHDFMLLGDLEFIKSKPAYSNVQAIENVYCIGIPLEKVKEECLNDDKFLRYICNQLGEKLVGCSKNSSINLLYPLENRLASYILATGERVCDNGIIKVKFNESLTEISELLGTSYRHLLRTLKILCTKGVIKKQDDYFEVIDEIVLKEIASDVYS
ncbi:cyclic nucleotide-binding domain-containing protein [Clostridium akagii]|uniref:cyclic nucleotide-binding domain-containing protein n=1 Tax=Clostridium akagii TaxID=91623 RepID=UPI00047AB87F|nr:cyclic nucleotide-binding domain-containing protein [Clostridium akagii]